MPVITEGTWRERCFELKRIIARQEKEIEELRSKLYPAEECLILVDDKTVGTWMLKPYEQTPGTIFKMLVFQPRRKKRALQITRVETGGMKVVHAVWAS